MVGTEPEHATLFTVRGRIFARGDDSLGSSVESLVDCGATSDFMSTQPAKRARLPLNKLTSPGHAVSAEGVHVEVRYCTRTYVRVGDLVFRHHSRFRRFYRMWYLGYHGFEAMTRLSTRRNGMRTYDMV